MKALKFNAINSLNMHKRQAGMTLTESLLVLAVGALVAVLAYGGYQMATSTVGASSQIKGTVQMIAGLKRIYGSAGNYSGITTTVAVSSGVVPTDFRTTASSITNAWGGAVTITPTTVAGAAPLPAFGAAANQGFYIRVDGIPAANCMDYVTGVGSAATVIQVGTAAAAASTAKAANAPVDVATASAGCAAGGNAATAVLVVQ